MKTLIRITTSLAAGALMASAAAHAEPGKLRVLVQGESPRPDRVEKRLVFHGMSGDEKEKVTFLGVETAPASPALTAQLGLPKGTGLMVRHVVEGSPAAGVLQEHDVLVKLSDQILIDPGQFGVLVRNRKEGEEVEVTYVRAGKEAKAKVTLGQQEVPKWMAFDFRGMNVEDFDLLGPAPESAAREQETRRVLSLLDGGSISGAAGALPRPPRAGFRASRVNPGNSTMVYTDEGGTLEVTTKDGKKTLVAKDEKGEPLYSGPIDTPEQREGLPETVRERLDRIEGMRDFSFEIGDEFHVDERPAGPMGRKISLPLPVRAPAGPIPKPAI